MSNKGQKTSRAERVEIGERWASGQTDSEIAGAMQRPVSTIRKWRRRYARQGSSGLTRPMGRPPSGALGHFPRPIVEAIDQIRQTHAGWGALTIQIELQKDPVFGQAHLPSRSRIAAYLHQQGYTQPYERHQNLPQPPPPRVERVHQEWEIDAQGKTEVNGLGGVSILLIEDVLSHLKIEGLACLHTTHPGTLENQVAFRRGFVKYGLPEQVSLDHDSVYYDNQTASPFPTLLHLWLIALGIQVRFIEQPPPAEHAHVERGHQLVDQQAVCGQTFQSLNDFQTLLTQRLDFLNREFPSRSLQGRPPLSAFPEALYTQRPYRLEWEADLLDLRRVYAYLAKGRWFRWTSKVGMFSLGAQRYNARTPFANQTLEITFDPRTIEFICLPDDGSDPFRLAALGLTKEVLMGELDPLLSVPAYQLALPFSREAWRQLLACQLTGTTL